MAEKGKVVRGLIIPRKKPRPSSGGALRIAAHSGEVGSYSKKVKIFHKDKKDLLKFVEYIT